MCSGLSEALLSKLVSGSFSEMPPTHLPAYSWNGRSDYELKDIMQIKCYDGPRSFWVLKTQLLLHSFKGTAPY